MDYRVYLLDSKGHIASAEPLWASSDAEARAHARIAAELNPVELWEGGRLVERFGVQGLQVGNPSGADDSLRA